MDNTSIMIGSPTQPASDIWYLGMVVLLQGLPVFPQSKRILVSVNRDYAINLTLQFTSTRRGRNGSRIIMVRWVQ